MIEAHALANAGWQLVRLSQHLNADKLFAVVLLKELVDLGVRIDGEIVPGQQVIVVMVGASRRLKQRQLAAQQ